MANVSNRTGSSSKAHLSTAGLSVRLVACQHDSDKARCLVCRIDPARLNAERWRMRLKLGWTRQVSSTHDGYEAIDGPDLLVITFVPWRHYYSRPCSSASIGENQ